MAAALILQFTVDFICESDTTGGQWRSGFIHGSRDNAIPGYQSFMSTAYPENGPNEAMKRSRVI